METGRPVMKRLREARGLSQTRLAEIVAVDHSYISRLEAGNRDPDRDVMTRIAYVIGLEADDRYDLFAESGILPPEGDVSILGAALSRLGRLQRPFLERLGHTHPSPSVLSQYATALQVEIGEMVNELPWKTWKPDAPVDRDRVADEFSDVLAFLGTWIVLLESFGLDPSTLARAYDVKRQRNERRFDGKEDGYKGVGPERLDREPTETVTRHATLVATRQGKR